MYWLLLFAYPGKEKYFDWL